MIAGTGRGFRARDGALLAAALAAVAAAYWPALGARALSFDDGLYLTDNYLVQHPSGAAAWRFLSEVLRPSTVGGYYQPLSMISLMLDVAMGGGTSHLAVFHATSLGLHLLNVALLALWLARLFGAFAPAAMASLLFGLHPLTVEPIPWVGERKTLLATAFALGALLCHAREAQGREWPWWRPRASAGLYLCALLSKPTVLPLPAVFLLVDIWPLRRLDARSLPAWRAAIARTAPLWGLAMASAAITYVSQRNTATTSLPGQYPAWQVPLTLCHNVVFYLRKIVAPVDLSGHYPPPRALLGGGSAAEALRDPALVAGVLGTAALAATLLASVRRTPALLVGWLVFFVAILPTMGIVGFTNVIASDKYVYFPAVGLLMVACAALTRAWERGASDPRWGAGVVVAVASLALFYGVEVRHYLGAWRDSDTLADAMLRAQPGSTWLWSQRANLFVEEGRMGDAEAYYERALAIYPDNLHAHFGLGVVAKDKADRAAGDERATLLAVAARHLARALQIKPDYARALSDYGVVLAMQGNLVGAIEAFRRAIAASPESADAYANLGAALLDAGDPEQAEAPLRRALELDPTLAQARKNEARIRADAHKSLGALLARQGQVGGALAEFREGLSALPGDADLRSDLGAMQIEKGDLDDAVTTLEQLLAEQPGHALARSNLAYARVLLGRAREAAGDPDGARGQYAQALRWAPEQPEARARLVALRGASALEP